MLLDSGAVTDQQEAPLRQLGLFTPEVIERQN
jgi:hypothetical protein